MVLLPHPTDFTEPWAFWDFAADQVSPSIPTGVASVVVSFFLSMYYNVINAWAFWYLFHSFQVCGLPVAQFGPTVAVEGRGVFALVHTRHHCQLGRGGGGLSKASETQGFSGGKSDAVVSPSMVFPEAFALSPHHEIQVKASLVTLQSHVLWCQDVLHPGMGLSDVRGEVWPRGRGLESVIPRGKG